MGLVNSTSLWSNRGFTGGKSLPVVGNGQYEVGCADIMVGANDEEDIGVFARIFYPAEEKVFVTLFTLIALNAYLMIF